MNQHLPALLIALLLSLSLVTGCGGTSPTAQPPLETPQETTTPAPALAEAEAPKTPEKAPETPEKAPDAPPVETPEAALPTVSADPLPESTRPEAPPAPSAQPLPAVEDLPSFAGQPAVTLNGGVPYFAPPEKDLGSFEDYSPRDGLNRCGQATACVGLDIMPTQERGEIGMVKPAGWHTVKYDCVDGRYLYNRCHLLGYQLTGENANQDNLITGTRYLNTQGMLPYENRVADYVEQTGNHVLYRVTPLYRGDELLCRGVVMEAQSVEDDGLQFCVWAFNAQPGVTIDYATGDSHLTEPPKETPPEPPAEPPAPPAPEPPAPPVPAPEPVGEDFVINRNTGKFHHPWCSSVDKMKESNKQFYTGSQEDLIRQGYSPCQRCCG